MVSKKKLAVGIALVVAAALAFTRRNGPSEPAFEDASDHVETE